MKNKIIFVRHGQSVANKKGIIADSSYPLTEEGLLQAKETANELLKDIENIDLIISSPYIRAVQTAEVFADECNNHPEIIICESLRERGLGELEGKPKTYDSQWYSSADTEHGLEPKQELFTRMQDCWEEVLNLSKGKAVLLVGHGISGIYLKEIANGCKKLSEMQMNQELKNAKYTILSLSI